MRVFVIEHTQNEETYTVSAYRTLDAAMLAAREMAEETEQSTYNDDDDVVITVENFRHVVYFKIEGQDSEEQWQVREIELIE